MKPQTTLSLHPDNPRYFLFRGKPEILVGSSEHYGALLNKGFDYVRYLDELAGCGLNVTRVFTGYYRECPGAFGIVKNTLAPLSNDDFVCPWERTDVPGAADGGNKFDLEKTSTDYMDRLGDFMHKASERGIVVELCLFCVFYEAANKDALWKLSPMHPGNNVNGVETSINTDTLKFPKLLAYQEKMVRDIVTALNGYDNLYYEICNESYHCNVSPEWEHHIASVIADTEKSLLKRHLIGRDINNGYEVIDKPDGNISIYNFHYNNHQVVQDNLRINRVIGCNETGFFGTDPKPYRVQAWQMFFSGCGLYIGLDFSFACGFEAGDFLTPDQPGTGGRAFRRQLKALRDFITRHDFVRLNRDVSFIKRCVCGNGFFDGMSDPGKAYLMFVTGFFDYAELAVPEGRYAITWLNAVSCETEESVIDFPGGGLLKAKAPPFVTDGGGMSNLEAACSIVRITP